MPNILCVVVGCKNNRAPGSPLLCSDCYSKATELPRGPQELTGGPSDYYLLPVDRPSRRSLAPYTAELQDILEALSLSWNAANTIKAIWRIARHHQGMGKPGATTTYDAEKALYFAHRLAIAEGLSPDQINKVLDRTVKPGDTPTA